MRWRHEPAHREGRTPRQGTSGNARARDLSPTDVSPETLFLAIGKLRKEARDEIDRLIRFLDETDNHMEREPDGEGDESEIERSSRP
jgi:hypothetical protein